MRVLRSRCPAATERAVGVEPFPSAVQCSARPRRPVRGADDEAAVDLGEPRALPARDRELTVSSLRCRAARRRGPARRVVHRAGSSAYRIRGRRAGRHRPGPAARDGCAEGLQEPRVSTGQAELVDQRVSARRAGLDDEREERARPGRRPLPTFSPSMSVSAFSPASVLHHGTFFRDWSWVQAGPPVKVLFGSPGAAVPVARPRVLACTLSRRRRPHATRREVHGQRSARARVV